MTTTTQVSGSAEKVNLNPKAEDCYFYFYSSCSKVCNQDSSVSLSFNSSSLPSSLPPSLAFFLYPSLPPSFSSSIPPSLCNRETVAGFVTALLLWAMKICAYCGNREAVTALCVPSGMASRADREEPYPATGRTSPLDA